jgi:AcrR family transcriptional regulator
MATADLHDEWWLTPKGRTTRERIVKVAAEVILSEGLSALNMDSVRKAASVSGSQLAHYFVDKPALIRAVLTRQINVVLDFHRQPRLHGLGSFDDFERWIDLNVRYLRRIGYSGTPTYHALAGQLAKSDDATRETLAAGYCQWVVLLEKAIQRMKDRGALVADADPRELALVIVGAHRGGGTIAFTYRQEWPTRRRGAIRGELSAHVRRRAGRTHRAATPPAAAGAQTAARHRVRRAMTHYYGSAHLN